LINEENNLKEENEYSLRKAPTIITELSPLFFSFELNPVAPKAQKKVPIPEGLDLDAWINEPLPESESNESEEEEEESYGYGYGQTFGGSGDLIFSDGNGATVGRRRRRKNGRKNGYESEDNEELREKVCNMTSTILFDMKLILYFHISLNNYSVATNEGNVSRMIHIILMLMIKFH
jgi:hypothetical protein